MHVCPPNDCAACSINHAFSATLATPAALSPGTTRLAWLHSLLFAGSQLLLRRLLLLHSQHLSHSLQSWRSARLLHVAEKACFVPLLAWGDTADVSTRLHLLSWCL